MLLIQLTRTTRVAIGCFVLCLIALSLGQNAWAQSLDRISKQLNRPIPGGVAIVALGEMPTKPEAQFQGQPVLVLPDSNQRWWAVVGLSLDTTVGKHQLTVKHGDKDLGEIEFSVQPHQYKSQHIKLKNKAMVSPPPKTLERIKRELREQIAAYQTFSDRLPSNLIFDPPVKGRLSSPFGLKRYFNGQPRNPHSGLDFVAPAGTPVTAPADGRILYIGDLYFNGLTVFVDHGQGLISMFCHLSSINHLPGDEVKRGDMVGSVGSTGRATGPHLHWNVSLNNARVDPALFLSR